MSMWREFKAFLLKENVLALAIAVVVGTALNKLVTAVVDDFIMPIVAVATLITTRKPLLRARDPRTSSRWPRERRSRSRRSTVSHS